MTIISTSGPSGIWRGIVTRLVGDLPYVEIPRLTPNFEYGPLELPIGVTLQAGQRVLLGLIEGRADDPVILAIYEIPPPPTTFLWGDLVGNQWQDVADNNVNWDDLIS